MFPDPADGYNLINEKRVTKQFLRNPFKFLVSIQDLLSEISWLEAKALRNLFLISAEAAQGDSTITSWLGTAGGCWRHFAWKPVPCCRLH
jgi:hypothetical protein